jgi:quinoprotein dehydrogenase-associated probable ABC transporter substrate-binding protein
MNQGLIIRCVSRIAFAIGVSALIAAPALAQKVTESKQLKVCADPNNMPLSNDKGEGFENKIAQAMADDMGRELQYTYFPQRMGFVRMTLRAKDTKTDTFKCDVIIGVPTHYDVTATTKTYMHSTYAMVYRKSSGFGYLISPEELLKLPAERLSKIRFGLFAQSPAVDWLLRNQLFDQAVAYTRQSGDPAETPVGTVLRDLESGKTDVAILWGPMAGQVIANASQQDEWLAAPFKPETDIKFDFEISMGLRFGEKDWKDMLDNWITQHQDKINQILFNYNVPLVSEKGEILTRAH